MAPRINSNTTRALRVGVNLRRTIILLLSSWASWLHPQDSQSHVVPVYQDRRQTPIILNTIGREQPDQCSKPNPETAHIEEYIGNNYTCDKPRNYTATLRFELLFS